MLNRIFRIVLLSCLLGVTPFLTGQIYRVTAQDRGSDGVDGWSTPVNLGPSINTAGDEFHFSISSDGLTTFFSANRPDGFGGNDIWYAQRPDQVSPWGTAHHFGRNINTGKDEAGPSLSPDEHWLFFSSAGSPAVITGVGGNDLWAAYRDDTTNPAQFDSKPPINLGPGVNTTGSDVDPTLFKDSETGWITMYFASDRTPNCATPEDRKNCLDIYQSNLVPDSKLVPDGTEQPAACPMSSLGQGCSFGTAVLVPELSSPSRDAHPTVSDDGLEIFFASNRAGTLGKLDLWVSARPTTKHRWATPQNLGPAVNSQDNERAPFLAADGQTLYFTSDRPGGFGGDDFYMTNRCMTTTSDITRERVNRLDECPQEGAELE